MKIAHFVSVGLAAAALTGTAARAGTVISAVGEFGPLPVTDATTSYATRTTGVFNGITDANTAKTATTFVDDFIFTVGPSIGENLAGEYDTSLSGNFFNMTSKSFISSFDVSLYAGTPGSGTELDTTGVQTLGKGSYTYLLDDYLKPGADYYLQADVTVPGLETGHYGLTAIAAPAPEPASWALMISGVAMLGGMLRMSRRRGWAMSIA